MSVGVAQDEARELATLDGRPPCCCCNWSLDEAAEGQQEELVEGSFVVLANGVPVDVVIVCVATDEEPEEELAPSEELGRLDGEQETAPLGEEAAPR